MGLYLTFFPPGPVNYSAADIKTCSCNLILNIASSMLLRILSFQFQPSYRHVFNSQEKRQRTSNFATNNEEKSLNNN